MGRLPRCTLCLCLRSSVCLCDSAPVPGADAILLGAETLRGLYPVDTVLTVRKICAEVGANAKAHRGWSAGIDSEHCPLATVL